MPDDRLAMYPHPFGRSLDLAQAKAEAFAKSQVGKDWLS